MDHNHDQSCKKKVFRSILSICLIVTLINSSILPQFDSIYQVQAAETVDKAIENDNSQDGQTVQETPAEQANPDDSVTQDVPKDSKADVTDQDKQDDQEQTHPTNILQADNTKQCEEQEAHKQEASPKVSVTLTAQTDFPGDAIGQVKVLEGEVLDNLKNSLNLNLEKDKLELSEINLPMEIGFINAAGEEQEKKEQVTVTVTPADEKVYQELKVLDQDKKLSLYHQKKTEAGNEWEKLDYELFDQAEDTPAHIEF